MRSLKIKINAENQQQQKTRTHATYASFFTENITSALMKRILLLLPLSSFAFCNWEKGEKKKKERPMMESRDII